MGHSSRVAMGVNDGERAVLAMKGLTYRPTNKSVA